MFQATRMLFLYVETPLHAGIGRGLGTVDLPIQRERTTGYPTIHASGLKGALRAEARGKVVSAEVRSELAEGEQAGKLIEGEVLAIFGPETDKAHKHAGALATGDARLLLFPVRSLAGVQAWVTSGEALARFRREASLTGLTFDWNLPTDEPEENAAWINGNTLVAGDSVVLEEFSFTPDQTQAETIGKIGTWLAQHALPQTSEYKYWRAKLPQKLCILPENAFRDFALYATEVQTHVKLDENTKTVKDRMLWTTENLPVDTLLYAPLMATASRTDEIVLDAAGVLNKLTKLGLARVQLGGDETTGQGIVALTFAGGAA